ncbi:uncharacterized protein [Watersipora subatra]|uniref:uncharacterized protein n=1 Tax=Watersipora subatra TaxID=2589382 RepID=UPI00355C4EE1
MAEQEEEPKIVWFPYLKNMMRFNVDDDSMAAVPYAKAELYFHVSTKFAQVCAMAGGVLGTGIGCFKKNSYPLKGLISGTRNGMIAGIPLGILATYGAMKLIQSRDYDQDMDYAYYDRAYRIRYNRNQIRVDSTALACLAAGMFVPVPGFTPLHVAAMGFVGGSIAAGSYNRTLKFIRSFN